VNRSKARGTAWESAIVAYLAELWPYVERRTQSGAKDRGDIAGLPGVVIEAKSAARMELSEWAKETAAEVSNAKARIGVTWIKRRGKTSAADGFVIMDGRTFAYLLKEAGW
jgi:hypothetical protein